MPMSTNKIERYLRSRLQCFYNTLVINDAKLPKWTIFMPHLLAMQCVEHVAAQWIANLRVQKPENAPFLPSEDRFHRPSRVCVFVPAKIAIFTNLHKCASCIRLKKCRWLSFICLKKCGHSLFIRLKKRNRGLLIRSKKCNFADDK